MKNLLIIFGILIGVALLGAGGAYFWFENKVVAPGPYDEAKTLVIEKGQGVRQIALNLENEGLVEDHRLVLLQARISEVHRDLKAGEYEFAPAMSIVEILEHLRSNNTVSRSVTIPEGLTNREIIEILYGEEALSGDIGMLGTEGMVLPETYHFSLGDTRAQIVERMKASLQQLKEEIFTAQSLENLPLKSWTEVLILASIVEKETAVPAERPKVASVFINRLRKGMRLQSDPTVIYALTKGERELGRPLTRADWKVQDPYNTYYTDRLPPGPIANPGRDSIIAVLKPEKTEYLYFVANGDGGHAFAKNLKDHNRNVAAWRRVKKSKSQ
ncbi:MAG: endolytic transglycosylase MltG [Alphaproteobacteria bacterium]|nr:endolytic transglycosylase MltG [Alphaproteobacteria bacterium]